MATTSEKLMLTGGVAAVLVAFTLIAQNQADQVALQATASPEAVAACRKIAAKAHGPFSQGKEAAVMDECLVQRDPAYAGARETAMCQQAKAAGVKPETFTDEFRKRCFG